jgi:sugar-specific transcriptional regulator TrmB
MENRRRVGRPADYSGLDPVHVSSLEFLGLSAYEIKVYLCILRNPRTRVPEIARLSKVPQPKVYATIKRLNSRGLIESYLGPVNRYSVSDPDHGFRPLIEEAGARKSAAQTVVSELQTDYLSVEPDNSAHEGRVKLFQSLPAATRSFRDRLTHVQREFSLVVRWPLALADYSMDIGRITKAGGRVRVLCEMKGDVAEDQDQFVKRIAGAGAAIRRIDEMPMRLAIFDEEAIALLMSEPTPHAGDGFIMLEVRNGEMSRGFQSLFETFWATGEEF